MKILNLTLQNFKGIRNFSLDTQGKDVNIYGNNATGKTSLFDAYTWSLFGKDSLTELTLKSKHCSPTANLNTALTM